MTLAYDFFSPRKILFGLGRRAALGTEVASVARRCFVVSGSRTMERTGQLGMLLDHVCQAGVEVQQIALQSREPLVSDVDDVVRELNRYRSAMQTGDCVLAVGGGSAIDLAKAVAAMATNPHGDTVQDFLEGVGRGLKIEHPPLPVIAVPTTSGTGAEATKNAVISSVAPAFKKSLRSDLMIPSVVIVDPELSVKVSPQTTAYTGMDAITQLIESYVSRRAKPIPQALCLEGLRLAIPALLTAFERPDDLAARSAMSHAALLSGMALANSGLGFAHGVAAALGVTANVPHGLACAVMLPPAMRLNMSVARDRFETLGRVMQHSLEAVAADHPMHVIDAAQHPAEFAVQVIERMSEKLHIPKRLSDLGVCADQIESLATGSRGNSMDGNPRYVEPAELQQLLTSLM